MDDTRTVHEAKKKTYLPHFAGWTNKIIVFPNRQRPVSSGSATFCRGRNEIFIDQTIFRVCYRL